MAPQVGRFAPDTPIFSLLKAKHLTSWRASEKAVFSPLLSFDTRFLLEKSEDIRKILHHLSRLANKLRTARACIEGRFQPLRQLRAQRAETLTWRSRYRYFR